MHCSNYSASVNSLVTDRVRLLSSELNLSDLKTGAAFKSLSYRDFLSVGVDNTLDNIQPKSDSILFDRIPRVEHLTSFTWLNPRTVILDEKSCSISDLVNRDCYGITAVFDCIPNQILELLSDSATICLKAALTFDGEFCINCLNHLPTPVSARSTQSSPRRLQWLLLG